jgi:glycosyltransferase domain-containing protein
MKSLIEFKHTSFLILVKDEKSFSKKLVNHINSQNIKAEIIIADGSKRKQKKIFDKLNLKKKYFYFGEDENIMKFFLKVFKGVKKCSKKFIFFCDQDDLINFQAIKRHETFLIKNKDYAAVRGIIYNFNYVNNKINLLGKQYNNYKDFNSFLLRHFFNSHFKSYYALRRKNDLMKIHKLINKFKLYDFRSAEFINDLITLSSNRIKSDENEVSVIRWSGVKKRDKKNHIISQIHNNRYQWFKYFFSKEKKLVKTLLKNEKMSFKNFYIFKLYIFLTDILISIIKKRYLTRILSKIFLGNYTNQLGKHFIKLNMNLIIDEKNLFNKN